MENILITGGAGFIGSHLTEKFLSSGYKVVVADDFTLGSVDNLIKHMNNFDFKLVEMDIQDVDALEKLMYESQINYVYHLAANSDIQKSAKNP